MRARRWHAHPTDNPQSGNTYERSTVEARTGGNTRPRATTMPGLQPLPARPGTATRPWCRGLAKLQLMVVPPVEGVRQQHVDAKQRRARARHDGQDQHRVQQRLWVRWGFEAGRPEQLGMRRSLWGLGLLLWERHLTHARTSNRAPWRLAQVLNLLIRLG